MVFAKPDTGSQYGTDLIMLADDRTIVITAIVAALLELAIATGGVAYPFSRLRHRWPRPRRTRRTRRCAAQDHDRQSAAGRRDAAEAHDTLAHSLSCWR